MTLFNVAMEIVLIRHAQPQWALPDGLLDPDPALSALGLKQADLTAARLLKALGPRPEKTRLLVSPLRRTQQTAAPLAEQLGLPVEIHDWLAEVKLPMENVRASDFALRMRDRRSTPPGHWWAGWPGGESAHAFNARIETGLESTFAQAGISRVEGSPFVDGIDTSTRWIISGHGGTNAALIGSLLGLPPVPWPWERFVLGHASVSVLRARDLAGHHHFGLFGCNDMQHLAPAERSR